MNKVTLVLNRLLKISEQHGSKAGLSIISAFFIALMLVLFWSLSQYWNNTLRPRLHKAAQTQASVLAESQSHAFIEVLSSHDRQHLSQSLRDTVYQIMIVEDPAIGERFIQGLSLQFDYSTVDVEPGSLDMQEGIRDCEACFKAEVPLISREGELYGVVNFLISDGYFQSLSEEMRSKLFAESSVALILITAVWAMMLFMFHRLYVAKQSIETSDRAKTLFMANVTHELRTPLNAILGYTQLYEEDKELMQSHGQGIETINRSAKHLLLMINDILEFSKGDSESLKLFPDDLDFPQFLKTLVDMTALRARLIHIRFEYEFDEKLPSIVVADEKRLRQVLLNLLGNAVKFTKEGYVKFKVTLVDTKAQDKNALIRFDVEDSGIGIDKKQLKSIFIPFHQIDNAHTRAEGSGLGLTISQRLVRLMGAELHVESQKGSGSRFWFDMELGYRTNASTKSFIKIEPKGSTPSILTPDAIWLSKLREQTKRHNILGIKGLIGTLEEDGQYADFIEAITPFVRHYKFKQLLQWLDENV